MKRHGLLAAIAVCCAGAAQAATIDLSGGEVFYTADSHEFVANYLGDAFVSLNAQISDDGGVVGGGASGFDAAFLPFSGALVSADLQFDVRGDDDVFRFLFKAQPGTDEAYRPAFWIRLVGDFGTSISTAFIGDFEDTDLGEGSRLDVVPLPAGALLLASGLGLLALRRR